MRKNAGYEFIYSLIYSVLTGLSILYNANEFLGRETEKKNIIVFLSLVLLIDLFVHINTRWRLILLGLTASLTAAFLFLADEKAFAVLMEQRWLLFVIPLAAGSYLISILIMKVKYTGLILTALTGAFLIYLGIANVKNSKTGIAFCFVLLLAFVTDEIRCRSGKDRKKNSVKHFVLSMPFFAVILLVLILVPAPEKRFEWTFVKEMARSIGDLARKISRSFEKRDDYFQSAMGFGVRGDLTGSVDASGELMMTLDASTYRQGNVYLKGKSFNRFDGREWTDDSGDICNDAMSDTLELLCAIEKTGRNKSDYISRNEMILTYLDMFSQYVFLPAKPIISSENFINYEIEVSDGGMIFGDRKGYKDSYPIKWYVVNRDNDSFRSLIEAGTEITEELWNHRQKNPDWGDCNGITYDAYLNYRKAVYEKYGEKPVLSEKLRNYLDKVLEGADSGYDRLKRLEDMLGSFEYTLNPGEIPSGVEDEESYLDYFILDSRSGFCSYYATAFVLLARAEGFPARYAQGYRVPMTGKEQTGVTSAMAHAWAEVYFDGVGWVEFEPTPGFRESQSWMTSGERRDSGHYSIDTSQYMHEWTASGEITGGSDEEPEEKEISIKWNMVILTIIAILLIAVLIYVVDRVMTARRYRSMTEDEKALYLCRRNISLLKYLGFERDSGETLEEFAARCSGKVPAESMRFIECYERLSYDIPETKADRKAEEDKVSISFEDKDGNKKETMSETAEGCFRELMPLLKKEKPLGYIFFSLRNDGV